MTEIPEHLLKRSRERRAAIGKGDDAPADADAAAPASTPAPAASTAAAATPPPPAGPAKRAAAAEPEPPKPPKPDAPYVAAAKQRRRIPFWAMATLSLMPLWAFMYVRALTEGTEVEAGPLGEGAEVYSNCASCHGANGGGGVGYPFSGGEVLESYPRIEDQIRYVYYGTEGYNIAGIEIPGNPDREGGPHVTGAVGVMPAFGGQLTQAEIVAVVCHERYTLGGADPTGEEYAEEFEAWCSPESPIFEAVEAGELDLTAAEAEAPAGMEIVIVPVGPDAVPGSAG